MLVAQDGNPALLFALGESGPGQLVPMAINARALHVAKDRDGSVWIGGRTNERMIGIAPVRASEAYLAKIDRRGSLIWERKYGHRNERTIESIAPLAYGGVVVTGINDNTTWLAKISENGEILWERFFGIDSLNYVAVKGSKFIVAGLVARGADRTYEEDVSLWTFDESGNLLDQRVVRPAINRVTGKFRGYGEVLVHPLEKGVYVFSSWWHRPGVPTEAIKLDDAGNIIWRAAVPWSHNHCTSGISVLPDGDALIACSMRDSFIFVRLNAASGAMNQIRSARPDGICPSSALFMWKKDNDRLWIFGSLGRRYAGDSCSWLGEIPLTSEVRQSR